MKALLQTVLRMVRTFSSPSKSANLARLERLGENAAAVTIRAATPADIPALAALHVKTWSDTYPRVIHPPTYKLREHQWKEQFNLTEGSWCCFVAENNSGRMTGFAKGTPFKAEPLPDFSGELSKIYLLREYQRIGLGSRLLERVVEHFLQRGVSNMVLFADPGNASCRFYEALGAEKLYDGHGNFHGAYGWRNLQALLGLLQQRTANPAPCRSGARQSTRSSTRAGN